MAKRKPYPLKLSRGKLATFFGRHSVPFCVAHLPKNLTPLGPDHASTLHTANNLAILYERQGRLGEAKLTGKQARGFQKALCPSHPNGKARGEECDGVVICSTAVPPRRSKSRQCSANTQGTMPCECHVLTASTLLQRSGGLLLVHLF